MADHKKSNIKLSENRKPAKYRIVEVKIKEAEKKKAKSEAPAPVDTVNKKKAAIISNNVSRSNRNKHKYTRPKSDTVAASDNSDKYKELAKLKMVSQQNKAADKHTISSSANTSASQANTAATQTNAVNNTSAAANITSNTVRSTSANNSFPNKNTDELRKVKAAALAERLEKTIAEESHNQAKKSFVINRVKLSEKAKEYRKANIPPEAKARFNNAVNNTAKAAVASDYDFQQAKAEAAKHYKNKIKLDKKIKLIKVKQEKAERKTEKKEKLISKVETAYRYASSPDKFAENVAKDIASKTKVGKKVVDIAEKVSYIDSKAEADNLADAAVGITTALPEKLVKDKVKSTVTNVISGRSRAEQLAKKAKKAEKKYGYEEWKAKRAERTANRAKEAAIKKSKVQFYKESKGFAKSASVVTNAKNAIEKVIKQAAEKAVKFAVEEGGKAALAAAAPVLIVVLIVIIVIVLLFSWITPHEETFYMPESNTWEPVMVESNEEILKGYLRHIGDYLDKKQLEIFEVVDINFGGFTPDKYNYPAIENRGDVFDFSDSAPKISTEYTEYYVENVVTYKAVIEVIPGDRNNPSGTIIWGTDSRSNTGSCILRTEYYKYDYDLGYEVRTTSLDYEVARTYLQAAVNIEGYLNDSVSNIPEWERPIYTCDNGIFSVNQDITDEKMIIRQNGVIEYEGNVLTYLLNNPKVFGHTAYPILPEGHGEIISVSAKWKTTLKKEIIGDEQYVFNNYIWNLYEYGNKYIKLSDDCDFEHIIAMAAVKKWQEIDSDSFDSSTYRFEITDADLDYCLDKLFYFEYSYKTGYCKYRNCWKSGDPPTRTCNRALTHKHLIGKVTNLQVAGGIDYILNRVLKMPLRSDYTSDEEYNKAKSKFETAKEIYQVYVEYIKEELGTSTKLPDYENDKDAQYRLLRMHQAGYGKKPGNPPTNVACSYIKKTINLPITTGISQGYDSEEHYFLDISWSAPAPEEYAEGKFVEIKGYNVYAYDRSKGTKRLLATVSETSARNIDFGYGEYGGMSEDRKTLLAGTTYTHIVVEAFNDAGKGPQSDLLYVIMK